ncbi:MAG TPA: hypothetical protein VGX48_10550 [Pyrinomonadaceae bacterium]|nr:hypothetical protein [Pyrinomonadaceae bacterium]
MWPHEPTGPDEEDLRSLFRKLLKRGSAYIESIGCIYPDQCTTDALTEYLIDRDFRRPGRAEITGEVIRLKFDGARDQLKVLNSLVRKELRGKQSHCRDCKNRNKFCPLPDDAPDGEDDGPRFAAVALPGPKTPEELFEEKETIEQALSLARTPEQRRRVLKVGEGYSIEDIARESGSTRQAVRKEISRYRVRLRKAFRSKKK